MKQFFRLDGPVFQIMNRVGDLVVLNLLCLLFSIPIISMGAAFQAMDCVLISMIRKEEPAVTKTFFRAFRNSFFQSTKVWLFFVFCGIVLAADMLLSQSMKEPYHNLFFYLSGCGCILLFGIFLYVFPLIARFENTMKQTIKNGVILSIVHGPRTIGMVVCWMLPLFIAFTQPIMLIYTIIFMLLIGFAALRAVNIQIMNPVLLELEGGRQ